MTCNIINARVAVLFTFGLVIGRLVGMATDGMYENAIVFTIVPIVVFLVLLVAHKLLDKVAEAEAEA